MTEKRFSGLIGEDYDLWGKVIPQYKQMQQTIGTLMSLFYGRDRRSERIKALDLGCGTGYTSKVLLNSIPKMHVWAVDNEPVVLDQAKSNLQEHVLSNRILFIQADILKYLEQQSAQTFEVIVSAQTLHNFPQNYRESVLKQIYKVLNYGGVFINADKYALDDPIKHQECVDRQLSQINLAFGEIGRTDLVNAHTEHCLRDNEPDLLMRQQVAIDQMTKIGFKDILITYRVEMDAILVASKPK